MNARDYCHWLKGVFDITEELTPEQQKLVRAKLSEVDTQPVAPEPKVDLAKVVTSAPPARGSDFEVMC